TLKEPPLAPTSLSRHDHSGWSSAALHAGGMRRRERGCCHPERAQRVEGSAPLFLTKSTENTEPWQAVLCVLCALCERKAVSSDPAVSARSPFRIRAPSLPSQSSARPTNSLRLRREHAEQIRERGEEKDRASDQRAEQELERRM